MACNFKDLKAYTQTALTGTTHSLNMGAGDDD
jgi:hypothetical protein